MSGVSWEGGMGGKHFRHREPLGPKSQGGKKRGLLRVLGRATALEGEWEEELSAAGGLSVVTAGWFCLTGLGRGAGTPSPRAWWALCLPV